MRKLAMAAVLCGLVGMTLAPACGGDSSSSSGSGGSGSGTGGAGGAATTVTNAATSSSNTGPGPASCVEVTDVKTFGAVDKGVFAGNVEPAFGGADDDYLAVYVSKPEKLTLALPANVSDCGETTGCVLVQEDATQDGSAAIYLAKGGTLDITSYDGKFLLTGSLTDVSLVEVSIAQSGGISEIANGKCVHVAKFAFDIKAPVDNWTCNPSYYDEVKQGVAMAYCDCNCGAVDPDCSDTKLPVDGCEKGQTCGAKATCEGVPSAWTCGKDQYNGGAGNGCDCGCGTADPDCKLMPAEKVDGCKDGEVCGSGKCLPPGWKCPAGYYDEDEAGPTDGVCDCGCGVKDPDCADGKLASCDYCDDMGSCSMTECKDNMEINPDDNAVCK